MSFWSQCPGPHWSDCFWSLCSCNGLPIAQPIRRDPPPLPEKSHWNFFLTKQTDAEEVVNFLQEHFQITESSKCMLPTERLQQGLRTGWILVFAKDKQTQKIVGTVASRFLGKLIFQTKEDKTSKFSNADYIDFFCVHPEYRKSGLGSELLKYIDSYSSQKGRPIHFFQKEITPLLAIPPLWAGTYIVRETVKTGTQNPNIQYLPLPKSIAQPEKGLHISFVNNQLSADSRYIQYNCGMYKIYVAITNTYHTYKNAWLGEVLFYQVDTGEKERPDEKSIAAAIEEIIEYSSYCYVLMDETIPHLKQMNWKKDAPYYIYAYNVNPRNFFSVKPDFWF